jgi:RNA polymerase sigma-70 factor (ECF subfamily)
MFTTTHWTTILQARDPNDPQSREAFALLCQKYEPPIRVFVRHYARADEERTRDLTQGFFLSLLEHGGVATVDPTRGRFRNWLLTCVKNHVHRVSREQRTIKRNDSGSLEFEDNQHAHDDTPERMYERSWALTVVSNALTRLEQTDLARDYPERYAQVRKLLVGPDGVDPDYAPIVAALSLPVGTIKTYLTRLRKVFRKLLHAELEAIVETPAAIEDELNFLLNALGVVDPYRGAMR